MKTNMKRTLFLVFSLAFVSLLVGSVSAIAAVNLNSTCISMIQSGYLTGHFVNATTISVTDTDPLNRTMPVGLAVYTLGVNINNQSQDYYGNQTLYDLKTATIHAGQTIYLGVSLPGTCGYQVDSFCGYVIPQLNVNSNLYGDRKLVYDTPTQDVCNPPPTPLVPEFGLTMMIITVLGSVTVFFVIRGK